MSTGGHLLHRLFILTQRIRLRFGLPGRKTLVGKDLRGNSYFEIPRGEGSRPRRIVEMLSTKPSENSSGSSAPEIRPTKYFTEDSIPVQWQAWLRFTRNTPPSLDELQRDQERIRLVKQRAEELERKWQEEKLRLEVDAHRQLEERKALATQHLNSTQGSSVAEKAVKKTDQNVSSESSSKSASETLSTENLSLPKGGPDHFQPGEWKPKNKGRS